jgi:hypothetical protein
MYIKTKLTLQGSWVASIIRLRCLKEHDDVLPLRRLPHVCTATEIVQIPIHALMRVHDLDLEKVVAWTMGCIAQFDRVARH